jgi:hypothetical protein
MFFHDASPHSCFLAVLLWLDRRNLNYLCQILTFPKTLDRLHKGQKKLVTSKSKNCAARVNAVLLCTNSAFHSWDLTCCLVQLAECGTVLMVHCAVHLAECCTVVMLVVYGLGCALHYFNGAWVWTNLPNIADFPY